MKKVHRIVQLVFKLNDISVYLDRIILLSRSEEEYTEGSVEYIIMPSGNIHFDLSHSDISQTVEGNRL